MVTQIATDRKYSIAEFMELPDDGKRYELVEGELIEMGQPGDEHGRISMTINRSLSNFINEKDLGLIYGLTCFRLAPKTVRAPDIAFVQASRVPPKTRGPVPVAPDLAIEVISPGDAWSDIIEKVREYQKAEVRLIWLVDPYTPCVFVYHQNDTYHTVFKLTDDLTGEDVVPGFKLAVSKIFV